MINFKMMMEQQDTSAQYPTGYDDCIVGIANREQTLCFVMSRDKIIHKLMKQDGMDDLEAQEFFEFNIAGAYVGPDTPYFVDEEWGGI